MRREIVLAAVLVGTLALSGCDYAGVNSLSLPGTVGTGEDSYQVKVQLPNAANLVPNTPVMVNDINVGTVTDVGLDGWTPTLTLSIKNNVKLPANVQAKLGQTSLLGSKHVELTPPADQPSEGTLTNGALIPESRAHRFPETEELLASVSLLLNGGGLEQARTITTELNRALGGREDQFRDLLTQLDEFSGGLDKQKGDIITALQGLDRLSTGLADQTPVIENALQVMPRALEVANQVEPDLVQASNDLGNWADAMGPLMNNGGQSALTGVLTDLEAPLRKIADADSSIVRSLRLLPFLFFPLDSIKDVFRGDYANFNVTVDLTLEMLDTAYLGGTPLQGSLANIAKLLREGAIKPGMRANNPLQLPLMSGQQPAQGAPAAQHPSQPAADQPSQPAPEQELPDAVRPPAAGSGSVAPPQEGLLAPVVPRVGG